MLHINLSHIRHNVSLLKSLTSPSTQFMAVVKNNAYGHGLIEVSRAAIEGGADWLGVVHEWEGLKLREAGIEVPILVLGWVDVSEIEAAMEYGIDVPVMSLEQARELVSSIKNHKSKILNSKLKVHLKIETGLNRFGSEDHELQQIVELLSQSPYIEIVGIYSHLAAVEEAKIDYAKMQLARFKEQINFCNVILREAKDLDSSSMTQNDKKLSIINHQLPIKHIAATSATILMPETHLDMVRCGIGIYGLWPSVETKWGVQRLRNSDGNTSEVAERSGDSSEVKEERFKNFVLKPALEWREPIAALKKVAVGEAVGYGCSWVAHQDSTIALVPVGYADGFDRSLSTLGIVDVLGKPMRMAGRVCTNVLFVDVTPIQDKVKLGDEVTLFSANPDSAASVDHQAERAQTINYELVTRLSERLERRFDE